MEAAISMLAAVLIRESSVLKEIAPFLSCPLLFSCCCCCFFLPFSLRLLSLNFIPVSFLLKTLHLRPPDTAALIPLSVLFALVQFVSRGYEQETMWRSTTFLLRRSHDLTRCCCLIDEPSQTAAGLSPASALGFVLHVYVILWLT